MIKFHDPRADMEIPLQSYELAIDLDSCNEPTIGLLANGFPDSERFLEFIAQAIARKFPNIRFKAFNKGNASRVRENTAFRLVLITLANP